VEIDKMTTWNHRNVRQADGSAFTTGKWTGLAGVGSAAIGAEVGGTIVLGGNVQQATASNFQAITLGHSAEPIGVVLNQSSGYAGGANASLQITHSPLAAGSFATMTASQYVMRKRCTELAGVANTSLRSGASQYFTAKRAIHRFETYYRNFLSSWTWELTGNNLDNPHGQTPNYPTYTAVYSVNTAGTPEDFHGQNSSATNPASQGAQDVASRPSLAQPGQLVYRDGSPNPALDLYQAKNNG
jgi:hypothetical protein